MELHLNVFKSIESEIRTLEPKDFKKENLLTKDGAADAAMQVLKAVNLLLDGKEIATGFNDLSKITQPGDKFLERLFNFDVSYVSDGVYGKLIEILRKMDEEKDAYENSGKTISTLYKWMGETEIVKQLSSGL